MIESRFPQCETVCEYGCGSGVNLFNLWAANLATRYYGFDINPSGIRMANQHAKRIGAANLTFKRANLVNSEVPYTNKYEVIITDAVLMFIGHNLIADVLRKTWNATTRGMVLHEFNGATALDGGRYIHDFRVLMSMIDPSAEVEIIRSPKDDSEQWSLFGSFVCITRTDPPARQTFQP
jgi:ribosomal protein L11 methylase PrmA